MLVAAALTVLPALLPLATSVSPAPVVEAPDLGDDVYSLLNAAEAIWADRAANADRAPQHLIDQQIRNIETSRTMLTEIDGGAHPDNLALGVALAKIATNHQLGTLGLDWPATLDVPIHESPSQALLTLAERHNAELTSHQIAQLHTLDDELPGEVLDALTGVVDAFLALDTAATLAAPETAQEEAIASVFAARTYLLDTILILRDALDMAGLPAPSQTTSAMTVPPAFALDLAGVDSTYSSDVALLIDVGGNDTYHNNAGGSNLDGLTCEFFGAPDLSGGNAALVDLGNGTDEYGNPSAVKSCGVNGGAYKSGTGFLLDELGDDNYHGGHHGVNGGGSSGLLLHSSGFLLDGGGDDHYRAETFGVNGGGSGVTGALLDLGGHDKYDSGGSGANGGASGGTGAGLLVDVGGNDGYSSTSRGTNGGSETSGRGFLLDTSGDDIYDGNGFGMNGGNYGGHSGFLLDAMGNDSYGPSSSDGVNGGVANVGDGTGALLDAEGNDLYGTGAASNGVNGGVSGHGTGDGAWGLLLDRAGDDTYRADSGAVNGGGENFGKGLLIDGGGTDTYEDNDGGTGTDKTVVPKGILGAQIDIP